MNTPATFHKVNPPVFFASWSTAPMVRCQEPDDLCSVHDPCPAHAADAAAYLASWSTAADPPPGGIDTEPELPPVYPEENGYKLLDTLMTRADQGRCIPCGSAAHRSQHCPLVADRLFAR